MLKCRDVSELVTDYTEGALPRGRWLAVRFHLLLCQMCRTYVDQMARTRNFLAGRSLDGPDAAVEEQLIAAAHLRPGE